MALAAIGGSVVRRYRQFHGKTGGIVGHAAIYALQLARAYEAAHDDETLEFVWEYDETPDVSWMDAETLAALERGETEMLSCVLMRKCEEHGTDCRHAESLASLGGIHVGPDDRLYRQIVEAELAVEAGIA